jgi:hypothetical protein
MENRGRSQAKRLQKSEPSAALWLKHPWPAVCPGHSTTFCQPWSLPRKAFIRAAKTAYAMEHHAQRLPESVGNYHWLKMEVNNAEIVKRGVEQITRENASERKKPGTGNEIAGRVFRYTST